MVNDAADEGSDIPVSPKPGSRTCSPLNMSSGVMTKRGPIVEQVGITQNKWSLCHQCIITLLGPV